MNPINFALVCRLPKINEATPGCLFIFDIFGRGLFEEDLYEGGAYEII